MRLTVNSGGMFSGKTSELYRQGQRHLLARQKVVFVKPRMDNRYAEDYIVTHNGLRAKAISVDESILNKEVLEAEVVLLDEFQFYPATVVDEVEQLVKLGKIVYLSGLDLDSNAIPFANMAKAMAMADEVKKFKAVCELCGSDAMFSYKHSRTSETIQLGEKDLYIPLCRKCFYEKEKGE